MIESRARVGYTQPAESVCVHKRRRPSSPDRSPGHGIEQGSEVGVLGGGVNVRMTHQFPAPGGGNTEGVGRT